eukprot:9490291-Pyramimonas_sp.AAC.1
MSFNRTARVCALLRKLTGHTEIVEFCAFSPDGGTLVTVCLLTAQRACGALATGPFCAHSLATQTL